MIDHKNDVTIGIIVSKYKCSIFLTFFVMEIYPEFRTSWGCLYEDSNNIHIGKVFCGMILTMDTW